MKIGIFGSPGSWYAEQLTRTGRKRGHEVHLLEFNNVCTTITSTGTELRCGPHDLCRFDAVIVRTMPPGSLEQVVFRMDALELLRVSGVMVVNPPKAVECAVDKLLALSRLAAAGIAVPRTAVCEDSETALNVFDAFGRDVVVKPLFGSEGRGIMRIQQYDLAVRAFRTLERLNAVLYLQEFLEQVRLDLRLLVLDDRVLGALSRQPAPGDFRANAAMAGTSELFEADRNLQSLARQAAAATGCIFAGVDVMIDRSGVACVIEVNAVPGWKAYQRVTGTDVATEFFTWLESIR